LILSIKCKPELQRTKMCPSRIMREIMTVRAEMLKLKLFPSKAVLRNIINIERPRALVHLCRVG
jgi:hypothetical protein